jgi:hypothetical protein
MMCRQPSPSPPSPSLLQQGIAEQSLVSGGEDLVIPLSMGLAWVGALGWECGASSRCHNYDPGCMAVQIRRHSGGGGDFACNRWCPRYVGILLKSWWWRRSRCEVSGRGVASSFLVGGLGRSDAHAATRCLGG